MKTIDDVTNSPGSFKRFLQRKERFLKELEQDRRNRILGIPSKNPRSQLSITDELALAS